MRGEDLIASLAAGAKTLTTRLWLPATVRRFQAVSQAGHLVRVQAAYDFESIVGWALLASVSDPICALTALNKHTLQSAGAGDLSPAAYIRKYISRDDPNPVVVLVVIQTFWPI